MPDKVKKEIPKAVDLECQIISGMILDNDVIDTVIGILNVDCFYSKKTALLFECIENLHERGIPADPVTVDDWIKKTANTGKITVEEIANIFNSSSTTANIEFHCTIVYEMYVKRQIIKTGTDMANGCLDPTANTWKLLKDAESNIIDLSLSSDKKKIVCVGDDIDDYITGIDERRNNPEKADYKRTGISSLDEIITGLFDGNLYIIAARPTGGKTALAVQIMKNFTMNYKLAVGMNSIEMKADEIKDRLISNEAEVNGHYIRSGNISDDDYIKILDAGLRLKMKMYIDDTPEINIYDLKAKARKMKKEKGISLLVVDYLQLVKGVGKYERRDIEVGAVSKGLKSLAKELGIPVIACCQLGRALLKNGKPRKPELQDLRESGDIEQDADVVIFIHRPTEIEDVEFHNLIIGKQRNGETGEASVRFTKRFSRFETYRESGGVF